MTRCRHVFGVVAVLAAVAALCSARPAEAVAPAWYFVLGQVLSDVRQRPVETSTVGLNPTYNVYTADGFCVGSNPDARVIVSAVRRGARVVVDPGAISRVDLAGFELVSNQPGFVPLRAEAPPWLLEIDTAGLSQGLCPVVVRVFYHERRPSGFLNLGRKTVTRREETLMRFLVLDPEYMAQAVNSVEIQDYLRTSFGLVGGPTQVGQLKFDVRPEVAAELNRPIQLTPTAAPATVPEAPAQLKPVVSNPSNPRGKVIIRLWDEKGLPASSKVRLRFSGGERQLEVRGTSEVDVPAGPVELEMVVRPGWSTRNPGWVLAKGQKPKAEVRAGETVVWDVFNQGGFP